jgi:cation diffusion facilitator CzcD-associated flavoprotein CzcO
MLFVILVLQLHVAGRSFEDEKRRDRFENYLGAAIAGFPNLFMIHGPGSPDVLQTMPLSGERTANWIAESIAHLRANNLGAIEATDEAASMWDDEINAAAAQTLYPLSD